MTTIVLEELKTTPLVHTFTIEQRKIIKAVRLYIYKHLSPSGTFTVTIKHNDNTIVSKSTNSPEMETLSDNITSTNYYHGFYTFEFDNHIILNKGIIKVELSSTDYTFNEGAYIGWVKEYINLTNNIITEMDDFDKPLSIQLWGVNYDKDIKY
jgi:hypothetical protein